MCLAGSCRMPAGFAARGWILRSGTGKTENYGKREPSVIQWNERRGKDKEGMAEQNQNQDMQKPHKRRVRYKGTHPRTFEEKYKEREPEKYAETIEKVISKGSTPAGMHLSICVDEILEFLQIQPGQRGLDATLGYGGHSRRMLEKLEGSGHLYGLDVDPIEIVKTETRIREKGYGADIFTVRKMNFADVLELSREVGKFDFILADLGGFLHADR